jgi:hypothetical protein
MGSLVKRAALCALLGLGLVALAGAAAEARQCVWNKSGFTLTIRWYTPDQVFGYGLNLWIKPDAVPYQANTQISGSGACSERAGRNVALLSSVDWWFFEQSDSNVLYSAISACGKRGNATDCGISNEATQTGSALRQYVKTHCGGYDPYVSSSYTYCTTKGADHYDKASCDCSGVKRSVPKFFAISYPTLDRYTDVWSSISAPQFCDGCGGGL